jgi:trehalose 6-phosphate phosphatase
MENSIPADVKNSFAMNVEEVIVKGRKIKLRDTGEVPHLFTEAVFSEVFPPERTPVIFLDFDGTLSEIVKHPEDASLAPGMKGILERCASRYTIAIISGRDMYDLKSRVNIRDIIYAGSHGFRISGPGGLAMEHEDSEKILPDLDRIGKKLNAKLAGWPNGVKIERKRYAIAIHYRNAGKQSRGEIKKGVDEILKEHTGFKAGSGKMIIEIRPDIDWHKGKALEWILNKLYPGNNDRLLPVYIGDDVTDEDAFKTILPEGRGLIVGSHDQLTAATYRLNDIEEVKKMLQKLYQR